MIWKASPSFSSSVALSLGTPPLPLLPTRMVYKPCTHIHTHTLLPHNFPEPERTKEGEHPRKVEDGIIDGEGTFFWPDKWLTSGQVIQAAHLTATPCPGSCSRHSHQPSFGAGVGGNNCNVSSELQKSRTLQFTHISEAMEPWKDQASTLQRAEDTRPARRAELCSSHWSRSLPPLRSLASPP